ncbi:ribonuclease Z [Williamwhitmania taraxaci]|uniref:Ribonuclease Z n=1 Tax=Williamwhitmania taraxaci TaxID=1640674 RepID=A0A1G6H840_9BACT|nr:ribonuclease Z [Williamwhitmania taraxaci]SDB89616.1 RNAse Z [Williamwhitmania taraxaci]
MKFSLTILGTSSALPTSSRFPTAHVLNIHERFFLVDCGEGTQMQLRRMGISIASINHIFISHLHGDHVFGLFGLISTLDLLGRKEDLHIYSYFQLEEILQSHLSFFGTDLGYKIIVHSIDTRKFQQIYSDKGVEVYSIPLDHRIPTCGFLFREREPSLNIHKEFISQFGIPLSWITRIKNGEDYLTEDGTLIRNSALTYKPYFPRSYAFCSDTAFNPSIAKWVEGVDLLYHEATFTEELAGLAKKTGHSTAAQAAQIAKLAGAKKLLLGHFSSRYKDCSIHLSEASAVFEPVIAVKEGDIFDLPMGNRL